MTAAVALLPPLQMKMKRMPTADKELFGSRPLKIRSFIFCLPTQLSLGPARNSTSYDPPERIPPSFSTFAENVIHVFTSFTANPCDVLLCLSLGGANKAPALSTDFRLLKIQDWVNSGKDDKLMPLITQRSVLLQVKPSNVGNQTELR